MAKLLKTPGLLVLFAAYTLFFSEVFLRLFAPQPIIPRHVTAAPYGVRMNVPNAEYRQVTPETRVTIRVNEQGMRAEKKHPLEKSHGITRIALFGDSYFMGYEADLDDSFAWQLEQSLRARQCPVEVINFAVSGFGTAEMLRTLEQKGLSFAPDIVVFQWHHSDPADNLRANLYQLNGVTLATTGKTYVPAIGAREILNRVPLYETVSENSHLYAATRERVSKLIKNALTGGAVVGGTPQKEIKTLDQPDRPDASPLDVALLQEAKRLAHANKAGFFVVDIPSMHNRTSFSSAFRLLPKTLTSQASYISPIEAFRAAASPDTKLYWEKGHYHLTPQGNALLAETVATEIHSTAAAKLACD